MSLFRRNRDNAQERINDEIVNYLVDKGYEIIDECNTGQGIVEVIPCGSRILRKEDSYFIVGNESTLSSNYPLIGKKDKKFTDNLCEYKEKCPGRDKLASNEEIKGIFDKEFYKTNNIVAFDIIKELFNQQPSYPSSEE